MQLSEIGIAVNVETGDGNDKLLLLVDSMGRVTTRVVENTDAIDKNTASIKENVSANEDLDAALRSRVAAAGLMTDANGKFITSNDEVASSTERAAAAQRQQAVEAEIAAARIQAVNEQNAMSFTKTQISIAAANEEYSTTFQNLTKLESVGTPAILKAATWGAFAAGGIAYEAIKQYTDFNKVLTQSITQAGRSASDLPFLTKTGLDIAKQTGVSLNDVGNMIYRVSSATAAWHGGLGATNAELAKMTRQVANLNVLGGGIAGAPAEQSARTLGALMNANLAGTGRNAGLAAAFINATTGAGDIKQAELISGFGRGLLAIAAAHGMSAASTGSFLDLLTTLGTPGSTAGQYAKTAINLLASPSAQGAKALAMVGIEPGTLNALLKQQNGIVAVGQYLHDALQKFNPKAFNIKYKGATGYAGAEALLQNWGVGDIPQSVVKAWAAGNLQDLTAKQLGSTESGATWLNTLENLIVTKAFGGSRSAGTIDTLLNNPSMIAGIYASITKHMNIKDFNAAVARSQATPAQEFARLKESLIVDLVSIGKSITPGAIALGKILVDVVNNLTKFKIVLFPLITMLGGIVALATVSKVAGIFRGAYGVLGSGFKLRDKILGAVLDKEGGAYKSLTKSGGYFKDIASKMENKSIAELGQSAIQYGTATTEFSGAVDRFVATTEISGGGSRNIASKAEQDIKRLEQAGQGVQRVEGVESEVKNAYVARLRPLKNIDKEVEKAGQFDRKLLNRVGGDAKAYNEKIAKRVQDVRSRSEIYNQKTEEFNRLEQMKQSESERMERLYQDNQSRLEAAAAAERATQGAVESDSGGILSKVASKVGGFVGIGGEGGLGALTGGGLGDLLGGILGGPVGMMMMSTLIPMLLPKLPGIIKGIGGFFSNLFGGTSSTSTTAYIKTPKVAKGPISSAAMRSDVLNAEAQVSRFQAKIASGKATDADFRSLSYWSNKLSNLQGEQKANDAAYAFATGRGRSVVSAAYMAQNATLQALMKKQNLEALVSGQMGPQQTLKAFANLSGAERQNISGILSKAMPSNFYAGWTQASRENAWQELQSKSVSAYLGKQLASNRNYLNNPLIDPSYYNTRKVDALGRIQFNGQKRAAFVLGQADDRLRKPGEASARYATFLGAALRARTESMEDSKIAEKLSGPAKEAMQETAKALANSAKKYEEAAKEVAKVNKLTKSDTDSIASAVVSGTKQANSELGLTQNGMTQAMVNAIGSGGIVALVDRAAKDLRARH